MKTINIFSIAAAMACKTRSKMNEGILYLILSAVFIFLGLNSTAGTYSAPRENAFTVPSFEDITVYRIQLKIYTCNNDGAGTDDAVYVKMNPNDGKFFLDKSINDYIKGNNVTYDVLTKSIKQMKDIKFMKLGLEGDDGTCIRKIQLFINNNNYPVFEVSYSGHGKWIDNNQSFTISGAELRNYSGWAYTSQHANLWKPPARQLSKAQILSIVEGSIGNSLHSEEGIGWGSNGWPDTRFGDGVEVSYVNESTLHFDLDLEGQVTGPNFEIDVDFDLVFSCQNGKIKTEVKNLKVEPIGVIYEVQNWVRTKGIVIVGTAIGAEFGQPHAGAFVGGFVSRYLSLGLNLSLPNPVIETPCGSVVITPQGNLKIQ